MPQSPSTLPVRPNRPHRLACRRRARRRAEQRGAVMFIVAMTLAVIGAMGIYALQIASTEVKTAGFIRQQLQTQYLSEYGVATSAQALSVNPQIYASIMIQQPDGACYSLFGVQGTKPDGTVLGGNPLTVTPQANACHRAGSPELGGQIVPLGTNPLTPGSALASGTGLYMPPLTAYAANSDTTRGLLGLPTAPDFFVEVTDPTQRQPPPGFTINSTATVCFLEVTASAIGVTPTTTTYNTTDTFTASTGFLSEGLQMSRARIMFGPLQCAGTN